MWIQGTVRGSCRTSGGRQGEFPGELWAVLRVTGGSRTPPSDKTASGLYESIIQYFVLYMIV